jgi:hypothetical protein
MWLMIIVATLLLPSGCRIYVPTRVPTPESGFTTEDLLLDPTAFPEGWGAEPPYEIAGPVAGSAKERVRLARSFYGYTTLATQSIYGYHSSVEAVEAYGRLSDRFFGSSESASAWEPPAEMQYQSHYADQFRLACAVTPSNYVCQALGQYKEYVIGLYIPMEPRTNVTYPALRLILEAMEERVASYLELERRNP